MKNLFSKIKTAFQEKKKKSIVITVIIVVLIAVIVAGLVRSRQNATTDTTAVAPTTIEKQDIEKTLSVTGSLISANETQNSASSDASSYIVSEVNVKVGDEVKEGDVLYKVDMKSVLEDLDLQQKSLWYAQANNNISAAAAERKLGETETSTSRSVSDAERTESNATEDLAKANSLLGCRLNEYRDAYNAYVATLANADATEADKTTAESKLESARSAYISAYDSAVSAKRSLESADSSTGAAEESAESSLASAQDNVDSTNISNASSILSYQQSIKKDKELLAKNEITAKSDGTVTQVNVVEGQAYAGTSGVVISNTENLVASCNIDEAQISRIEKGMKVIVKTDSTGDEELTGVVTFVAETPTKAATSTTTDASTTSTAAVSTTRATYRVDVTLDQPNEDLRIGMTAKMNIILDSKEECLVVPISYIKTKEDGSNYITVTQEDGTTKDIAVEVGIENDYYAEVTGKIEEGMTLAEDAGSAADAESVVDETGVMGGIEE